MAKYSPKRAAMILLDNWIAIGGNHPDWMDSEEMSSRLHDYGWKITEKRRDEILIHAEKILEPLKNRISSYVENIE
jgi:hypothetical protein